MNKRNTDPTIDLQTLTEFPLGSLVISKKDDHVIGRLNTEIPGHHWRIGPIMGFVTGKRIGRAHV